MNTYPYGEDFTDKPITWRTILGWVALSLVFWVPVALIVARFWRAI